MPFGCGLVGMRKMSRISQISEIVKLCLKEYSRVFCSHDGTLSLLKPGTVAHEMPEMPGVKYFTAQQVAIRISGSRGLATLAPNNPCIEDAWGAIEILLNERGDTPEGCVATGINNAKESRKHKKE